MQCPVCGEHAHARLRACDSQWNAASVYRCHGPDGRDYLHLIDWPKDIPDVALSPTDLARKRVQRG